MVIAHPHPRLVRGGLVAATLVVSAQMAAASQGRPSVVIQPIQTRSSGWAATPPALGEVAAELLISEVVGSGRFRVVDPRMLEGLATAEGAVDYVLSGAVVECSLEKKRRGFGGFIPVPLLGGVRSARTEATVAITLRLVSTASGEVVSVGSGRGIASRKTVAVGGLGLRAGSTGGAGYSSSAEDSRDALLGEAVRGAVREAARQLLAAAEPR